MPSYTISSINVGNFANDGQGDPLRTAFVKINQNFANVYSLALTGNANVTINGSGNANLAGYATIAYVNATLANANINVNLTAYATKSYVDSGIAGVAGVGLSDLNNALTTVRTVDLTALNSALANVRYVDLGNLNNALANVQAVNLNNLNNVLATVNVTSLANVTSLINTLTANAPGKVAFVSNLSANGSVVGQSVVNQEDDTLYVWNGNAWATPKAFFTPNANSIASVQTVSSLPVTGLFNGRQVLLNGSLYIYNNGGWRSPADAITPTANSLATVQIWNEGVLPAGNLYEGRTIFWTNDNGLYIYRSGAWSNFNSFISGSGNVTIGANTITSAALGAEIVVASKIAANAIIAGKIAAAAVGAQEISAGAITAGKIAANAITSGTIAAGAITAAEIAAGAITSNLIASNAIIAGKISAAAIGVTQLAANAVTANAIAANSIYSEALQANAITANKIAANAITAVQLAANAVYAGSIQSNAITTDKLAANSITSVVLAADSVYANAIQTNAITTSKIAANAITAVQLAANSVYANALQANSITSGSIAANAITAVQLAANSVYANALQTNSVTTASLAANAITSKHIAANTITAIMIDSRGLTIRASDGTLLFGAGSGGQSFLANTITVTDNTGTARTLANVVTASSSNALQFIGSYANNSAADAAYGGSAPTNSVYTNTTDQKTYVKTSAGTWTLFVTTGTGTSVYTADVFLQSASAPSAPTGGSYNFTTSVLTAPTSWSTTQPASTTTPTYAATFTFTTSTPGSTVTGGTWSTPRIVAQNGSNGAAGSAGPAGPAGSAGPAGTAGTSVYAAEVYLQQSATPSAPSGGTFNFSTSVLSAPASWTTTLPTVTTTPIWISRYTFSTSTPGSTVTAGAWNTPVIFAQKGGDGARGNQKIASAIAGSTWADNSADSAITNLGLTKVIRDEVTLYNTASNFSETRFWTGSAWSSISAYINGGLVVNGTISANQLAADSVTAGKIQAGAITTDKMTAGTINGDRIIVGTIEVSKLTVGTTSLTGGSFSLGEGAAIISGGSTYQGLVAGETTVNNKFGALFSSSSAAAALGLGNRVGPSTGNVAEFYKSRVAGTYATFDNISLIGGYNVGFATQYYSADQKLQTKLSAAEPTACAAFIAAPSGGVMKLSGQFGSMVSSTINYGAEIVNWYNASYPKTIVQISGNNSTINAGIDASNRYDGSAQTFTRAILAGSGLALGVDSITAFGGVYYVFNTSGTVSTAVATATNSGRALYSIAGSTGPFTGSHDAYIETSEIIEIGDIVCDLQVLSKKNINDTVTKVTLSSMCNQKSVVGVVSEILGANCDFKPTAFVNYSSAEASEPTFTENFDKFSNTIVYTPNTISVSGIVSNYISPEFETYHTTLNYISINSLGEGLINVCGENGNIEIGDLISSSSILGKGMKQSDDIVRNYTVAKSRENVTFSSSTEVKLVACTYHCG